MEKGGAPPRNFLQESAETRAVVNTCGWVSGLGGELLADLVAAAAPTHLILLETAGSHAEPPLAALEAAATAGAHLIRLPSLPAGGGGVASPDPEAAVDDEAADAEAAPTDAEAGEDAEEEGEEEAASEEAPVEAAEETAPVAEEPEEPAESAAVLGHRDQIEADMAAAEAEARGDDLGVAVAEERESAYDSGPSTPWGASFTWNQAFSAYTLAPNAQLTYNPTYAWNFAIAPSYTFAEQNITLSLAASMSVELTDSNSTATRREIWINDTSVSATYTGVPELGGFSFTPTASLVVPTSRSSLAATRLAGTGLSLSSARSFGPVSLSLSGSYSHWFAQQNVPTTESDYGCHIIDPSGNVSPICNQIPGYSTTRDTATASVAVSYAPTDSLSLSTSFAMVWAFGHPLADACFETISSDEPVCLGDGSATHLRGLTSFSLGAGYTLTDYLSATLAMTTTSPHLDTDGSYEMPLFNERTQVSLSATLDIDALYRRSASGGDDSDEAQINDDNVTAASGGEAVSW